MTETRLSSVSVKILHKVTKAALCILRDPSAPRHPSSCLHIVMKRVLSLIRYLHTSHQTNGIQFPIQHSDRVRSGLVEARAIPDRTGRVEQLAVTTVLRTFRVN